MAFHTSLGALGGIVGSLNLANPIGLGVNIIVSTIIGGVVFLIVAELLAKGFRESIPAYRAFLVVLIINVINMFGVINLIPQISILPSFVLQVLIWVGLVKLAFNQMSIKHAIVVGVVGFVVSILVIPTLVGYATSLLPLK